MQGQAHFQSDEGDVVVTRRLATACSFDPFLHQHRATTGADPDKGTSPLLAKAQTTLVVDFAHGKESVGYLH